MRSPKYRIKDRVYHITVESDKGVVVDARYSLLTGLWEYQVAFSATLESLWYYEHELSENMVFD
jgi:hypothetical protein